MRQSHKTFFLWAVLVIMFVSIYQMFADQTLRDEPRDFSQIKAEIVDVEKAKRIELILIQPEGNNSAKYIVKYKGQDQTRAVATGPYFEDIFGVLQQSNVPYRIDTKEQDSFWQSVIVSWLPMIFLFALFFFFIRQLQIGGGKAMSFGKSRAKLLNEQQGKITFKDVAGIEEAKDEVEEIVEFLKDPKRFTKLGGRIPKGVLMMGSPGTGKTLLARAIAGEADVAFFSISGSDFVEMFVGVGASRVRDLFEQGKKNAPCIVFIDEIDAVGRHRGAGLGGGHDEREQTLNQLLVEMDGFESTDGVILIAATNRPDVLDPALLRPGRFDRRIMVPRPDLGGRTGILEVHTKNVPLGSDVELNVIARGTPGFSGADIEALVNEAALVAARYDKSTVDMEDFEHAKDKVIMGTERRSMIISEKDRKTTAYHEAGHALVAKLIKEDTDPVHKVTIIPRGQALGLTQQLPEDDRLSMSKDFVLNTIAIMMGGRIAEELEFNQMTTGASNDIQQATGLARRMVTEWGMSEKIGPLCFAGKEREVFLGRDFNQTDEHSQATGELIDHEISRIVTEQYERANKLLRTNRDKLTLVSEELLKYETLSGDDIDVLLSGGILNKKDTPYNKPPVWRSTKDKKKTEQKDKSVAGTMPNPEPA